MAVACGDAPAAPVDWRARLPDEYPEHVDFVPVDGRGVGMFVHRDVQAGETVLKDTPFFTRPSVDALANRQDWTPEWFEAVDAIWAPLKAPPLANRGDVRLYASAAMVRGALGFARSAPRVRRDLLQLWHPPLESDHPLVGITRQVAELCAATLAECRHVGLEELQRAILAIEMNSFVGGRVFRLFSRVNHSCIPNVVFIVGKDDFKLKALRPIRAGEEMVHSYLAERLLLPTDARRWHLWRSKCFHCVCERCVAPGDPLRSVPCRPCAVVAAERAKQRALRWRVVHSPGVWRRAQPSTQGRQVGFLNHGQVVETTGRSDGAWAELAGGQGWVLTHGEALGLGTLCVAEEEPPPLDPAWGPYRRAFFREWDPPAPALPEGITEAAIRQLELPPAYILDPAAVDYPHAVFEGGRWRCPDCGREERDERLLRMEAMLSRHAERVFFSPEIVKAEGLIGVGGGSRLAMIREEFLLEALQLAEIGVAVLGHRHWSTQWARILLTDIAGSLRQFGHSHGGFFSEPCRDLCLLWDWLDSLGLAQGPSNWLHTRAQRFLKDSSSGQDADGWFSELLRKQGSSTPLVSILPLRNYVLERSVTFG